MVGADPSTSGVGAGGGPKECNVFILYVDCSFIIIPSGPKICEEVSFTQYIEKFLTVVKL